MLLNSNVITLVDKIVYFSPKGNKLLIKYLDTSTSPTIIQGDRSNVIKGFTTGHSNVMIILLSGVNSHSLAIYDMSEQKTKNRIEISNSMDSPISMALSPDESFVAILDQQGKLLMVDIQNGSPISEVYINGSLNCTHVKFVHTDVLIVSDKTNLYRLFKHKGQSAASWLVDKSFKIEFGQNIRSIYREKYNFHLGDFIVTPDETTIIIRGHLNLKRITNDSLNHDKLDFLQKIIRSSEGDSVRYCELTKLATVNQQQPDQRIFLTPCNTRVVVHWQDDQGYGQVRLIDLQSFGIIKSQSFESFMHNTYSFNQNNLSEACFLDSDGSIKKFPFALESN
jgi:hypothetical protein